MEALRDVRPTTAAGLIALGVHVVRCGREDAAPLPFVEDQDFETGTLFLALEAWAGDAVREPDPAMLHAAE